LDSHHDGDENLSPNGDSPKKSIRLKEGEDLVEALKRAVHLSDRELL